MKILGKLGLLVPWQRRKALHILTGPIYILTWTFFTDDSDGAMWAALVPFGMTVKFALIGTGLLKDEDAVLSVSRSGDKRELLAGPLLYGLIFVAASLQFWKSARAVITLFILCFGDGFAEIGGRKWGSKNKWRHNKSKSIAGSISFVLAAILSILTYYFAIGRGIEGVFVLRVVFVSLFAAAIESLPIDSVDNVTVFLAAIYADGMLFRLLTLYNGSG
ncbi:phosphatidate cytidylyltransferase [archaeon]|nr:MAG: phosphatidate cytidylyltransferase [archaeon]